MSIHNQDISFDQLVASISDEVEDDYGLGDIDEVFPENGVKVKASSANSRGRKIDRREVSFVYNDHQYSTYNFEDR